MTNSTNMQKCQMHRLAFFGSNTYFNKDESLIVMWKKLWASINTNQGGSHDCSCDFMTSIVCDSRKVNGNRNLPNNVTLTHEELGAQKA